MYDDIYICCGPHTGKTVSVRCDAPILYMPLQQAVVLTHDDLRLGKKDVATYLILKKLKQAHFIGLE